VHCDGGRCSRISLPSGETAASVIPVTNESGKDERHHEHRKPEEEAMTAETWTTMWIATVWPNTVFACGIGNFPVGSPSIPIFLVMSARVIVEQRCGPWYENAFTGVGITDVVELAGAVLISESSNHWWGRPCAPFEVDFAAWAVLDNFFCCLFLVADDTSCVAHSTMIQGLRSK
jgi:hypothetical protein